MNAYCENCMSMQPSSFRSCMDASTGENYEDLCCDSCHLVIASVVGRDTEALADRVAQAQAEEREACASIVEDANTPDCGGWTAQGIADAIRARGGKEHSNG